MQVGNILFIFGLVNAYIPSMMYMPVDYQDDIMGDMVIVYYSVTGIFNFIHEYSEKRVERSTG